jgi:multidrug efflux pump subunit AcrA (membrane-fusion protein)
VNFRYKALQKMREPDELDAPTILAAPRGWVAVLVVLIVMGGGIGWTFRGRLPVTVSAPGLLTRPNGTAEVQSPYTGVVEQLTAASSGPVTAGQTVAEVQDAATGRTRDVTAPFSGTVVSVAVAQGQVIAAGSTLVTVERTDAPDDRMIAMVFVPSDRANGLHPGADVGLNVSSAPSAAFGLLRGTVTSVGTYPLTEGALAGLVGGDLAAKSYVGSPPPRLVVVDLVPDAGTVSGFAWSTKAGPPMKLPTQTTVQATITLGTQTPFNLVLGR